MADTRTCPVNGCPHTIVVGKLMCRAHWSKLPTTLQHEVYTTWKAFKDIGRHDPDDSLAALGAYRAAAQAAIAAAYTADVKG